MGKRARRDSAISIGGMRPSKIMRYVRPIVRTGVKYLAPHAIRYLTGTQEKTKSQNVTGVTSQHDVKRQYTKKKMPYKKKQRWAGFVKKVQAVNLRDRGLKTVIFNKVASYSALSPNQLISAIHLYGYKSGESVANEIGMNDIGTVVNNDPGIWAARKLYIGGVIYEGYDMNQKGGEKIQFESGLCDYTYTNTNTATIEVDVYDIVYKPYVKGTYDCISDVFDAGSAQTKTIQDSTGVNVGTAINLSKRGVTPFEMGKAISMGNMKILSKTKHIVSAGQAFTGQLKDSSNRWLTANDYFQSADNYRLKTWTRTLLFIAKKVVSDGDPTTCQIGCTRTYKYGYEGLKQNESTWLSA